MTTADWGRLAPLPIVTPYNKGKPTLSWAARAKAYANLPVRPLLITAELVTPVLHAEQSATHLDSIISAAVLTDHPHPSRFQGPACVLPLPLALLWVSPEGLPLWACTPLRPLGEALDGREYWHKRYPSHRADLGDKLSANTSAGRWREYRIPLAPQHTTALGALAIGNADEIRRLLEGISHIGKKGSQGFGRVARWSVLESGHDVQDVLMRRAVPIASGLGGDRPVSRNRAWTAPYWYAPWWADCTVPE